MKKRTLIASIIYLSILFSLMPATVYAKAPTESTTTVAIEQRASNTKWLYKTVNGKLYRRLYDLENSCWIGNWELCS